MNCISQLSWRSGAGRIALLMFSSFAAMAGCSGGGIAGLYPVSGTVTYQGQPVEGALISFIGKGETRPATAVSKKDGTYELYTLDSRGALPGSYNVVVTKTEAPPESANKDLGMSPAGVDLSMEQAAANVGKPLPKPKELLPAKYGSPATTTLNFEVKNTGKNVFDLKLE